MSLQPLTGNDLRIALTVGRDNGALNSAIKQDWAIRMGANLNGYLQAYSPAGWWYSEFLARVSGEFVNGSDAQGQAFLTKAESLCPDPDGPLHYAIKKMHFAPNPNPGTWAQVRSALGV